MRRVHTPPFRALKKGMYPETKRTSSPTLPKQHTPSLQGGVVDFRPELRLIAGPWLYTLNSWALSYIVSLGVGGIISPLENNRQNLERSVGAGRDRLPR
ncbi:MAG: hypothetical protein LBG95_05350, partial [Treponema sp.]|nr:hypothetical protein [Treponema sp.]